MPLCSSMSSSEATDTRVAVGDKRCHIPHFIHSFYYGYIDTFTLRLTIIIIITDNKDD